MNIIKSILNKFKKNEIEVEVKEESAKVIESLEQKTYKPDEREIIHLIYNATRFYGERFVFDKLKLGYCNYNQYTANIVLISIPYEEQDYPILFPSKCVCHNSIVKPARYVYKNGPWDSYVEKTIQKLKEDVESKIKEKRIKEQKEIDERIQKQLELENNIIKMFTEN